MRKAWRQEPEAAGNIVCSREAGREECEPALRNGGVFLQLNVSRVTPTDILRRSVVFDLIKLTIRGESAGAESYSIWQERYPLVLRTHQHVAGPHKEN